MQEIRIGNFPRVIKKLVVPYLVIMLVIAACTPGSEPEPEPNPRELCEPNYFDDLTVGDTFFVSDVIVSQGFEFVVEKFEWSDGNTTDAGEALVEDHSGDFGIFTNNVNLRLGLGSTINGLSLIGEYHGGNMNLEINNDFQNFIMPSDVPPVVGGASVSVTNLGSDTWRMDFNGTIDSFAIGGQEFWLGDLCLGEPVDGEHPETSCAEFETLALGTTYTMGDIFSDGGIEFNVAVFTWGDGSPATSGFVEVSNQGDAGGSGQELTINNVNLIMDFGGPVDGLSLRFGEYGGNLNININGDFQNFDLMSDLNGLTPIGGVDVNVTGGLGNDTGVLELAGNVTFFSIGGQEFFIDEVCPGGPGEPIAECIEFEDIPLGSSFTPVVSFPSNGSVVLIEAFTMSGGFIGTGPAGIENTGLAGHSGNELRVSNVMASFDFGFSPLEALSLAFGEYGGELYLEINGDGQYADLMSEYDGITLGGVNVMVAGGLGNDTGLLAVEGDIQDFMLAGQELWVDHVCPYLDG
jgi:hypothetical protein